MTFPKSSFNKTLPRSSYTKTSLVAVKSQENHFPDISLLKEPLTPWDFIIRYVFGPKVLTVNLPTNDPPRFSWCFATEYSTTYSYSLLYIYILHIIHSFIIQIFSHIHVVTIIIIIPQVISGYGMFLWVNNQLPGNNYWSTTISSSVGNIRLN